MAQSLIYPLKTAYLDDIMKWVNDKEVIGNFAKFNHEINKNEEKKFLNNLIHSKDDLPFAIETKRHVYLGDIGIHNIDWKNGEGRLAIILGNKKYWNKGYAQDAIKETLKTAFEKYHLHKIWLEVFKENKKARHLYEKIGFNYEKLFWRKYMLNGIEHPMMKMSITEEKFFKNKQRIANA